MSVGIVLRRTLFREHDEIVSLMTLEHGRSDVMVRGVKKIVSKLSQHLDPLTCVSFETVQGKEVLLLTSVQCIDIFAHIRTQYHARVQAAYALDLVYTLTRVGHEDYRLYTLLFQWLQDFPIDCTHLQYIYLDRLVVQFVGVLGFGMEVDRCVWCEDVHVTHWSLEKGGVACKSCYAREKSCTYTPISPDVSMYLGKVGTKDFLVCASVGQSDRECAHALILAHARYHTERNISDWRNIIDTLST